MNASMYDWNVSIDVGGVTFEGPGMESKREAEAIKNIVEGEGSVDKVEVFKQ